MGFSALTPLTLSSSMVSGDNIKNRLDLCWLSPATHGLRDSKCHRWVCAVPDDPKGPGRWSCGSFMMSLALSTSPYFHVFSGLTLKRSNHCEVQMFCAPSHRPRHEPEGLTHGVVERCLRIRLMFLLWCFMWAAVNIRGSQDAISSIRSATIHQFVGIRTLYYCNTNDFDSCPCPCAFRRTPGNNFQDSIMYRHGNASFWRGTQSIVKFDESCSFTLQPQCVARSRHTCGSLWHRMIMNLEREFCQLHWPTAAISSRVSLIFADCIPIISCLKPMEQHDFLVFVCLPIRQRSPRLD